MQQNRKPTGRHGSWMGTAALTVILALGVHAAWPYIPEILNHDDEAKDPSPTSMPSNSKPAVTASPIPQVEKTPSPSPSPSTGDNSTTKDTMTALPSVYEAYDYYYGKLDETQKKVYDKLLNGVKSWPESIPVDPISKDSLTTVYNVLIMEHPELFYLSNSYQYQYSRDTGLVMSVQPEYTMDEPTYKTRMEQVDRTVDPLVKSIASKGHTVYERVLMAHDWLVEHNDYRNDASDTHTNREDYQTMYGAFVTGEISCMGYSDGFLYLMGRLGIPALNVKGYGYHDDGSREAHEWNMVMINGAWYHVDVCWDDPIAYGADDVFKDVIRHGYMGLTDGEIRKDHSIEHSEWSLPDPPATGSRADMRSYYQRRGMEVSSAGQFKALLGDRFHAMMDSGEVLDVQFTDDDAYKATVDDLSSIIDETSKAMNAVGSFRYYYQKSDSTRTLLLAVRAIGGN